MPGNHDYRSMVRRVCSTSITVLLLSGAPLQAAISEWVDIHVDRGWLLFDSKVGGVSGFGIIDSGAQGNAINGKFLKANGQSYSTGKPVTIQGVYETAERRTYNSVPVDIFGNKLNLKKIVELNFGNERDQLILGAPFLKQYVFQFDYPNRRMRLVTRDSINLKKLKNVKSKRDLRTRDPIVNVRLNDESNVWLLVDTGNSGGILLKRSLATKRKWLDRFPAVTVSGRGAISTGQSVRFNLPKLKLGDFDLENVIVRVPAKGENFATFERKASGGSRLKKSQTEYDGILGYDVLKHFVVTIDYKTGHMHLGVPAPASAEPAADADQRVQ